MRIAVCNAIDEIDAGQWNRLVPDNNPFLKHQFLAALERHGCASERFGWSPRHLLLWQGEDLLAATPLYLKQNSYGEFVFDHAWADAYARQGLNYFPKLVSAIPYTPATGQRLLVAPDISAEEIRPVLMNHAVELAKELRVSSLHWLFVTEQEASQFNTEGYSQRLSVQFHWHNRGYRDFEDFLTVLTAKRRKNIRRERRAVQQAGLQVRLLHGQEATKEEWAVFARFYTKTFEERLSLPTLNQGFFTEIGQTLGEQVILVLCYDRGEAVAGALMFRSDKTLYGRHWGCERDYDSLHFEACYYQGIEYAIANHLQSFEPGAQGEHKIWRGFLPTMTYSHHWIAHPAFREAIHDFLQRERPAILDYKAQLSSSSPYRNT